MNWELCNSLWFSSVCIETESGQGRVVEAGKIGRQVSDCVSLPWLYILVWSKPLNVKWNAW